MEIIEKRFEDETARRTKCVTSVQESCPHEMILERPSGVTTYAYIEDRWYPAVRVCHHCGFVEESRYGWPSWETTGTPLYNTIPKSKTILNRADFTIDQDRLHREIVKR